MRADAHGRYGGICNDGPDWVYRMQRSRARARIPAQLRTTFLSRSSSRGAVIYRRRIFIRRHPAATGANRLRAPPAEARRARARMGHPRGSLHLRRQGLPPAAAPWRPRACRFRMARLPGRRRPNEPPRGARRPANGRAPGPRNGWGLSGRRRAGRAAGVRAAGAARRPGCHSRAAWPRAAQSACSIRGHRRPRTPGLVRPGAWRRAGGSGAGAERRAQCCVSAGGAVKGTDARCARASPG